MIGHILDKSPEALKFIFAGNSIVTFLNETTRNRFTFRVKKLKNGNLFFVSVLTSPDTYTYIGTVVDDNFKWGKKSNISFDAQSVKVFGYVIKRLKSDNLPSFIEVWHEGRCGKCGRPLTVPNSILTGIGPECAKNLSKKEKRDMLLTQILS